MVCGIVKSLGQISLFRFHSDIPPIRKPDLPPYNERTKLPVYTLDILSSTTYVVTTPDITAAVQRNSKVLCFNHFLTSWLQPLYNMGDHTMAIMRRDIDCEEGDFGYIKESYDLHHGLLFSSPTLTCIDLVLGC